jgi:hypothetical protein
MHGNYLVDAPITLMTYSRPAPQMNAAPLYIFWEIIYALCCGWWAMSGFSHLVYTWKARKLQLKRYPQCIGRGLTDSIFEL